jgi:transmembrane sensor
MSSHETEAPLSEAEKVRLQATEWLVERIETESWTPEKQEAFDAWLAETLANQLAFWRAEDSWNRAGLVAEFRSFAPRPQPRRGFRWAGTIKGAAAIAAVAIIAIGTFRFSQAPASLSYSTPVGGQKSIVLADGSRIDLNTDSILAIDEGSPQRSVTLKKGEAYFRIKHDAKHPFTVWAAGRRITDLGTAFTVRNSSSRVVVALVEGSARVDVPSVSSGPRSAVLKPGDVAVATANTMSVTSAPVPELQTALSWRRGLLIFRHTTLAEAAAEFNRYNQQKLVIEDAGTARMELRGTFRANDARAFAHMAKAVMGIQIEFRGDDIVLHR